MRLASLFVTALATGAGAFDWGAAFNAVADAAKDATEKATDAVKTIDWEELQAAASQAMNASLEMSKQAGAALGSQIQQINWTDVERNAEGLAALAATKTGQLTEATKKELAKIDWDEIEEGLHQAQNMTEKLVGAAAKGGEAAVGAFTKALDGGVLDEPEARQDQGTRQVPIIFGVVAAVAVAGGLKRKYAASKKKTAAVDGTEGVLV